MDFKDQSTEDEPNDIKFVKWLTKEKVNIMIINNNHNNNNTCGIVCFVSVFVQHLILVYSVFSISCFSNIICFFSAGFGNNPCLCILQSRAQQGV